MSLISSKKKPSDKKFWEMNQKPYELNFELSGEKKKGMRSVEFSLDEVRKMLAKELKYYVQATFSVVRVEVERGPKWERYCSGVVFLLERYDNMSLVFVDAFPEAEEEYSILGQFEVFQGKNQIAKLEQLNADPTTVILRTISGNFALVFPKLYPLNDIIGIYNKTEARIAQILSGKKEKKSALSSVISGGSLSGAVKLTAPSKPASLPKHEVNFAKAKEIEAGLSEEWKEYLRDHLKLKLSPKKNKKNLGHVNQAVLNYHAMVDEMNKLMGTKPTGKYQPPPTPGSPYDKKFKQSLKLQQVNEKLDILGGGFE